MVIISTSATEVSIQAVSPEFGVQLTCILASQAGGGASAGAAAAGSLVAAGAAGAWANDRSTVTKLTTAARRSPPTSANSPARENFLNVMGITPVLDVGRALKAPQRRFRRCGCGRLDRCRIRRF